MVDFVFKEGGTFEPAPDSAKENTRIVPGTQDKIEWRFKLNGKVRCRCVFLVVVFHFRDQNGKLIQPAVKGFEDSFVKDNNFLPHDGKDKDGYAVDAPKNDPETGTGERRCPKYISQRPLKGSPDVLTGEDTPGASKRGLVEIFETAVICFDKLPYTILGSMRWRLFGTTLFIDRKDEKIDHGDPSTAFKNAVSDWIGRFGDEGCCPEEEKKPEPKKGGAQDEKPSDQKKPPGQKPPEDKKKPGKGKGKNKRRK